MICYITSVKLLLRKNYPYRKNAYKVFFMCLPKLNENQSLKCEGAITENELLKALTSMDNDKSPGNDGITKEFYIKLWDVVKEPLCASIQQSFIVGELSASQKQTIIKLIEKKDRDKRFIKNWRSISLLNVDMKLISKVPELIA